VGLVPASLFATDALLHQSCENFGIAAMQDMHAGREVEDRAEQVLADAGAFFESHLWESDSSQSARAALAEENLDEEVIRAFGVGYAPIGHSELMGNLRDRGYSEEEIVGAGLATRSVRGRAHVRFRSRIMFPVRDREGRILGFAGLGTHLGPSWSLWVTSPEAGPYRPSEAVFGLDRAAARIAESRTALVRPDCIEVLRAHQQGRTNAVTVHTNTVTREQMLALAADVPGGIDALELDLPPGMRADPKREQPRLKAVPDPARRQPGSDDQTAGRTDRFHLKRLGIVTATALAASNIWIGAPLLALWVGSQAQDGRLLSMRGVVTVVAVLALLAFLLGWALTWLSARYDRLTGRPATAGRTSPWHRAMRGDRVEDIRTRYGISAPEKVVAVCVVAGVLAFEIWFFFFAGSSLPSS
jgi:hypothetical protein